MRQAAMLVAGILGSLVLCAGCDRPAPVPQVSPDRSLVPRIERLESSSRTTLTQLLRLRLDMDAYKKILIDPTARGYQRLDTPEGMFLVSCQDVTPFLDGHKLKLDIGNITSATYQGFILNFEWGPSYTDSSDAEKWSAQQKTKEVSFTETLAPGTWNHVSVNITPSTPDELKNLYVTMTTNTVLLNR